MDGNWYYGDSDDYGWLYCDGTYLINGKEYAFARDGRLWVNATYFDVHANQIITTNASGAVVKSTDLNGWAYAAYHGIGCAYYY